MCRTNGWQTKRWPEGWKVGASCEFCSSWQSCCLGVLAGCGCSRCRSNKINLQPATCLRAVNLSAPCRHKLCVKYILCARRGPAFSSHPPFAVKSVSLQTQSRSAPPTYPPPIPSCLHPISAPCRRFSGQRYDVWPESLAELPLPRTTRRMRIINARKSPGSPLPPGNALHLPPPNAWR